MPRSSRAWRFVARWSSFCSWPLRRTTAIVSLVGRRRNGVLAPTSVPALREPGARQSVVELVASVARRDDHRLHGLRGVVVPVLHLEGGVLLVRDDPVRALEAPAFDPDALELRTRRPLERERRGAEEVALREPDATEGVRRALGDPHAGV